jgi:hypothetical protein
MKLECETKKIIKVDYSDLERYILYHGRSVGINFKQVKNYGNDEMRDEYEIVAEEEWNNYSSQEITVEKGDVGDNKMIELASGKLQWNIRSILTLFANNNLLEEGEYLINIYW